MTLARDEIKEMAEKIMAAKRTVDDEWKAGKRDGVRLQVYALADDVLRLLAAIEADDPFAYKVAATEAREHAGNACFHAALWVNKTREGERPATASGTLNTNGESK